MTDFEPIDSCLSEPCIYRTALDAVTVPTFIQADHFLLYANPAALACAGVPSGADLTGRRVDELLHADSVEASRQRRELATQLGASIRGVPVKGRSVTGEVLRATADGERISDSRGRAALVHLLRELDGKRLSSYLAPTRARLNTTEKACSCLHEAAFEALPVPAALHDADRFLAVNAQARHVAGGDVTGLPPHGLTHPHAVDAGTERRRIAIDTGHSLHDISLKLNTLDGSTVYVTGDAVPCNVDSARVIVVTIREARR